MSEQFFIRPFNYNFLSLDTDLWYDKYSAPSVLTYQIGAAENNLEYIFDIKKTATNFSFSNCVAGASGDTEDCICFIESISYGGEVVDYVTSLFIDNTFPNKPVCNILFSYNNNCKDFVFYKHEKDFEFPSMHVAFSQGYGFDGIHDFENSVQFLNQDSNGNKYTIAPNEEVDLDLGVEVFVYAAPYYGGNVDGG